MASYFVTVELGQSRSLFERIFVGRPSYGRLSGLLHSLGAASVLETSWIVKSDLDENRLWNKLARVLMPGDRLLVLALANDRVPLHTSLWVTADRRDMGR